MIDSLYERFRLTEEMVTVKARKESRDDAPVCAIPIDRERFKLPAFPTSHTSLDVTAATPLTTKDS